MQGPSPSGPTHLSCHHSFVLLSFIYVSTPTRLVFLLLPEHTFPFLNSGALPLPCVLGRYSLLFFSYSLEAKLPLTLSSNTSSFLSPFISTQHNLFYLGIAIRTFYHWNFFPRALWSSPVIPVTNYLHLFFFWWQY